MEKRVSHNNIQARHNERRQKRIREQRIRRYTFFGVLSVILILVVMFWTPFFNIRTVNITGNNVVTMEQITEKTGKIKGENLFSTSKRSIVKKLKEFSYIESVTVKKKPFPPTLTIEIIERTPAFQINYMESFIVVDSHGMVLDKRQEKHENLPVCEGLKIVSANKGETISLKDDGNQKIVFQCIGNMKKADILKDITLMSFEDMTNITFNYQSRLDVICGTHIDFQRKLGLFKEAVNSNKLTQNSRGTINLSTTGKAIYTP